MSFPRYAAYNDSGVEWLGEVPQGWEVAPLKRHFQIIGGSTPKSDNEEYWDGEIIWVTPSDLSKLSGLEIGNSQRKITTKGLHSCGTTLAPIGSIILSTRAPIGSLAIATTEFCTNQGCKSLIPTANTDSRFYGYLLSISSTELNIRGKGTTFLELSGDELGFFKTPFPPVNEQILIAAFLDCETAKIDNLINEQKKLIELLKEKRQAVISTAVTKGLNPHAPMKDSGVEWLGEVPEHWEICILKHVANLKSGDTITSENIDVEGLHPVFGGNGLRGYTSNYTHDGHFALIGRQGALCGNINYVMGKFWASEHAVVVNPIRPIDTIYLGEVLRVMNLNQYSVSAAQPGLSVEIISNLRMPFPPNTEQIAITIALNRETAKIDNLIQQAQKATTLLQERRTALISAAVTGKIDVRGFATNMSEVA